MASERRLRILVTNDDGPPSGPDGHSPFVYRFARQLVTQLGADVRVVVPASQRSWVGKSYMIAQKVTGAYYYARGEDGTEGETCELPRKCQGDEMEWILLDGTPATCASIALHNLFPAGSFDLVVSGPNFGRNTSTAFALSSGTLGAALAASLSGTRAIALSWGLMEGYKPPPANFIDAAADLSCQVIERLVRNGWGPQAEDVDVYSVNVPLLPQIVSNPEVRWTTMAKTSYGRLFKSTPHPDTTGAAANDGGPAAVPEPLQPGPKTNANGDENLLVGEEHWTQKMHFAFAPDISSLINPRKEELEEGTDKHALHEGAISVTPMRAAFEAAQPPRSIPLDGLKWKM